MRSLQLLATLLVLGRQMLLIRLKRRGVGLTHKFEHLLIRRVSADVRI